ncbi:MAG TPA: adenylyl-sulfate kinase [Candidatus Binatia bacterium]|nr:adenylyl-sulfate kinase [Candidatus Binatia bacterium]
MSGPGFTVWVTGADGAARRTLGEEIAARLRERGLDVDVLDESVPGVGALVGEGFERRVACVAGALARHGVATVVTLAAPTRAARDGARAELQRMIEVWVRGPAAEPPSYEPPDRPEVEVSTTEPAGQGATRTLRTLEVLRHLPRDERSYSESEEREVIRRLKAFGYL